MIDVEPGLSQGCDDEPDLPKVMGPRDRDMFA